MAKKVVDPRLEKVGKVAIFRGTPKGKSSSGIGVGKGEEVEIVGITGSIACPQYNVSMNGQNRGWCYEYELEFVEDSVEEFERQIELQKETIVQAQTNIEELTDKIKFMKENSLDQLDTQAYKAYKVLKVLGLGSYTQAMEIVKILG